MAIQSRRHPNDAVGQERVCPVTGQQFKWCWTNNLLEPWESFNECDQCGQSPAQTLHELNEKAKRESEACKGK